MLGPMTSTPNEAEEAQPKYPVWYGLGLHFMGVQPQGHDKVISRS